MKTIIVIMSILILMLLALSIAGCTESEKRPVYGQGETTLEYQSYFGNGNLARLNFRQTNTINSQGQAIAELAERVRKLEESNPKSAEAKYEAELKRRGLLEKDVE